MNTLTQLSEAIKQGLYNYNDATIISTILPILITAAVFYISKSGIEYAINVLKNQ